MSNCATCRHHYEASHTCRRYPPATSVILIPGRPTVASGGQPTLSPTPVSAFPQIPDPEGMGCGEWAPNFGVQ